MRGSAIRLGTLTIPATGNQFSPAIVLEGKGLRGLGIFAPAGAQAGTISFDVSADGGETYRTLQSGGSDVGAAAGKCLVLDTIVFTHLRMATSSAAENELVFQIAGVEDIT